jgi:archaellum component FlaG (FlaF/FlaG flagellin family)
MGVGIPEIVDMDIGTMTRKSIIVKPIHSKSVKISNENNEVVIDGMIKKKKNNRVSFKDNPI